MSRIKNLTPSQLETWIAQLPQPVGQLPTYVPLLATVDPTQFAVWLQIGEGGSIALGAVDRVFVLMSVVKPFLLLFLLHHYGEAAVFARVGRQPSPLPFNSLEQLIADQGFPRNPMINSGAIALADRLPGETAAERCECFCQWLNDHCGSQLRLDRVMLDSVCSLPNATNQALAIHLSQAGYLDAVETGLETYKHLCCLAGTVEDLARLGQLLVQPHSLLSVTHQQSVMALMQTCGLYEASEAYATRIGLPIKSGVSGAMLALVPEAGVIACYSPLLDAAGNSVFGLTLLERIAQELV